MSFGYPVRLFLHLTRSDPDLLGTGNSRERLHGIGLELSG